MGINDEAERLRQRWREERALTQQRQQPTRVPPRPRPALSPRAAQAKEQAEVKRLARQYRSWATDNDVPPNAGRGRWYHFGARRHWIIGTWAGDPSHITKYQPSPRPRELSVWGSGRVVIFGDVTASEAEDAIAKKVAGYGHPWPFDS